MNFYKRYMGDYARDTGHLSLVEHGAYQVLLDTYYATDGDIPTDKEALYRLARAMTPAERKAVDMVAEQFFPVNGDGTRHNRRADTEIRKRVEYAEGQRQRAGKRWGNTDVMPLDMPTHEPTHMPTHEQGQCRGDASHSHSQKEDKPRKRGTRKTSLPADFAISDRVREWAERKGFTDLDRHFESFVGRARAKGYSYVDWDEAFMTAVRDNWANVQTNHRRVAAG